MKQLFFCRFLKGELNRVELIRGGVASIVITCLKFSLFVKDKSKHRSLNLK